MIPIPALVAAGVACLVAVAAPAHRPIAVTLVAVRVIEFVRPELPPRWALAMLVAIPVFSAWSAIRAFVWRRVGAWCVAAWGAAAGWVLLAPAPRLWWGAVWPAVMAAGLGAELAAWAMWRRRRGTAGVTQRTAAALVGGDAGGFVLGEIVGWDGVWWWGQAVALVVLGVQLVWLRRMRAARDLVGEGASPVG